MRKQKCPYCGKRVSYMSAWSSRRKGSFLCQRCTKESKVVISKSIYLVFAVFALVSLAIMAGMIFTNNINNPLGIVLVAIPLLVFLFLTPRFVCYEPLKKYRKSMEARKAGIEYSDNLLTEELENEPAPIAAASLESTDTFAINTDVFNKIKAERSAARDRLDSEEITSSSVNKTNSEPKTEAFVPVIKNTSENHVSTDAPLRKLHSDNEYSVRRNHHYVSEDEISSSSEKAEKKQPQGNRYSANRRF